MQPLLFVGFIIAAAILIGSAVSRRRKKKKGFLAICEYWVYIEGNEIPKQETLMDRMINANPHNRPGRPCIGAREGMLFTDIRLHVALAKKSKNPLVFRPDLFQNDLVIDKEVIDRLNSSKCLIKVRYLSEVPLTDTRHLQFVPHMADAMSDLTKGLLVYDVVAEKIVLAEEFARALAENNNAERPLAHVRVAWLDDPSEGASYATTKGMRKVGLQDLRSDPVEPDQRVLVTSLLEQVAHKVIKERILEGSFEIEEFGDKFAIELVQGQGESISVRIKRLIGNG